MDDLDDRWPCPDGSCIGIIGPDGRCTECGVRTKRGGGGPLRAPSPVDDREPCPDGACLGLIGPDGICSECGEGRGHAAALGLDEEADEDPLQPDGAGLDPDDREPCPDGACIGIIGADGRCSECGRRPA